MFLNMTRKEKPERPPDMQFIPRKSHKNCNKKKYKTNDTINVTCLINMRTLDNTKQKSRLTNYFGIRRMITSDMFNEELIDSCDTDKVFSSMWLNDKQVLFGTKCKKLKVFNALTKEVFQIPTLRGSVECHHADDFPCGMHSIQMNPSKTLVATGAKCSANVGIYQLPSLEPVCVGENGHGDWVFDMVWLDDEFIVSGGRDSKISLWQVSHSDYEQKEQHPSHFYIQPTISKKCRSADKIRSLAFSKKHLELVALSVNARLHVWDIHSFKQKQSYCVPFQAENVCLRLHEQRNCYAVGSKSHITMIDADTLVPAFEIIAEQPGCSIRSLSFNDDLLTIGTGIGTIMFYDLRAQKYLQSSLVPDTHSLHNDLAYTAKLITSRGTIVQNDSFWDVYHGPEDYYRPAIYTHSYDVSRTHLFVGGGPLPAALEGCYLGLWR
ncbi:DDB1- and CUL4-associated factor 12 [Nymphon striatum]|nr:DDB1- and CUL4-associated factor 12 [Nymphon striatum]